jgi:hypothetical protein
VHHGLEVVVSDVLERRDRALDLLAGDPVHGFGHRLVDLEGVSHTGRLPREASGNPR